MSGNRSEFVYRKIAIFLREQISNKIILEGEKIPSETALSIKFGVTRTTVRRALDLLVEENLIVKRKGKGTFVKKILKDAGKPLEGFTKGILEKKLTPETKVLSFRKKNSSARIAKILKIESGEKIYVIERVRYVKEIPYILEISYLSCKIFPNLKKKDLKGSKYEYINRVLEKKITKNRRQILPKRVDDKIMSTLHLKKEDLVLEVFDVNYLENEIPFEFTISYFNTNNFEYSTTSES